MYVAMDAEFFNSNEKTMCVVACVFHYENGQEVKINTLTEEGRLQLDNELLSIKARQDIIVSYAAIAEARALISLGFDPFHFQWIDLYVEFIMACNSNFSLAYGNYIGDDGSIRFSVPPDLSKEDDEDDKEDHSEVPKNLINCAYKMLGVRLDQEEKNQMRDLILSKDLESIQAGMTEILDYCASDTIHLNNIRIAINDFLAKEGLVNFEKDQLERGRYAVAVAKSETLGIPIDMKFLQTIIDKTPEILEVHKKEVNQHFNFFVPETQKEPKVFKNGKVHHYKPVPAHKDMSAYQTYIESLNILNFPKTETGKYKSDKDTLEAWGYWGGLESLWKYNKTESSLKWFSKDNKNGFFNRMGQDWHVRPYYGIFGTQTGRNAAKAKTFPLAMSSWLRSIISPPPGKVIIGCDFSQQEVYVAAVLSNDDKLLAAYKSGDVYLAFAKQAGLVPANATKESHKLERNLCKSTVLGLQFGMGAVKLRTKLELDSGQKISEEKTKELINAHKRTYVLYWAWVHKISEEYKCGTPLITRDGWVLFTDNQVMTSVRNFLVQGTSASITRSAVVNAWELGLNVMCSLHDALYIISDAEHEERDKKALVDVMLRATEKILHDAKTYMRVDVKVVRPGKIWVEEKSVKDLKKLAPYLGLDLNDIAC